MRDSHVACWETCGQNANEIGRVSYITIGPFFMTYQNLPGRCLVCKHGSHVINIPKADWSSVKNKQLTATPC